MKVLRFTFSIKIYMKILRQFQPLRSERRKIAIISEGCEFAFGERVLIFSLYLENGCLFCQRPDSDSENITFIMFFATDES